MYADVNSFDSPSLGKNDNVYTQETCLTESTEQSNKTQVWNSDIGNYEDLINEGKQQKQVYEELKPVIHVTWLLVQSLVVLAFVLCQLCIKHFL